MRLVFFQLIFLICSFVFGQNYSDALPKLGDEQYSCEHLTKVESFMVDFGRKDFWDFNYLTSYWAIKESYVSPKTSKYAKLFPNATLVVLKSLDEEEFFKAKDGSLFSLGKIKFVNYRSKNFEIIRYLPEKRVLTTSKKMGMSYENNYTTHVKISRVELVPEYQAMMLEYDSLHIEIAVKESVKISDEGQLIYSNTTKAAQKHEVSSSSIFKVRGKRKNEKTWTLINKFDSSVLPEELSSLYKGPKTTRVDYISPSFKGVALSYDNTNKLISKINYQDIEPSPYMKNISFDTYDVIVSPNPTTGNIALRLFNHPFDNYTLEIYNLIGKKVFTKTFTKKDGRNLKADISTLKRGTYMFSLIDNKGKKMMTKRISLIGI
jgi:hypothetical protein